MNTLMTTVWGDWYGVRANWGQPGAQVWILGDDGWIPSRYQVGASGAHEALRAHLIDVAIDSGDYSEDSSIARLIDRAVCDARWID